MTNPPPPNTGSSRFFLWLSWRLGLVLPFLLAALVTLITTAAVLPSNTVEQQVEPSPPRSPLLAGMQILFVGVSCFGTAAFAVQRQRLCRELSQSNRRLASEATRFRAFLQNARDGIHILDIKGNIVDASDSFCRMLGYTRDETIGMNVVQWDANHTPAELEAFVKELFGRPETSTFETRHRRKDGSVFDVEVSGCPLEMDGQMVLFHSARDIADRKLAEQQMRVLEERYRNIFDTLLSG